MHGYRAAMEGAGVPVPEGFVRSSHFIYSDGVDCGLELLDLRSPPTAIFAADDGAPAPGRDGSAGRAYRPSSQQGEAVASHHVELATDLILRESTAPPRTERP